MLPQVGRSRCLFVTSAVFRRNQDGDFLPRPWSRESEGVIPQHRRCERERVRAEVRWCRTCACRRCTDSRYNRGSPALRRDGCTRVRGKRLETRTPVPGTGFLVPKRLTVKPEHEKLLNHLRYCLVSDLRRSKSHLSDGLCDRFTEKII